MEHREQSSSARHDPRRGVPAWVMLAIFTMAAIVSCVTSSPEAEKRAHRERGLALHAAGQYDQAASEFQAVLDLDPTDADAHYRLGLIAIQRSGHNDRYAGMAELARATELDRHHRDAAMLLADLYLRAGQPAQAKVYVLRLLEARSRDPQALMLQGRLAARDQDYRKAIRAFEEAIAEDPSLVDGYRRLALAQESSDDQIAAEDTLRRAMRVFGPATEIGGDLGDLLRRMGKVAEAAAVYRKSLDRDADNETLLLRLAESYRAMQAWDQAETLYAQMRVRKPSDEKPLVWIGDLSRDARRPSEARARYEEALKLQPESRLARDRLIDHLLEIGEVEQADTRVQRIYEDNPKDPMAWYFDGRMRRLRGDLDTAIDLFRAVVRVQPDFSLAHLHLGLALMDKGNRRQALQALAKAIELSPSDAEARIGLGTLYLSEGSVALALEQAHAARRVAPQHLGLAALLGDIYVQQHRYDEAEKVTETLRHTRPNDPTSPARQGRIARARQNDPRAEHLFEDALKLNPHAIEPMAQLVEMRLAKNTVTEARERVLRQLELSPENPLFTLLLGRLWQAAGDLPKAETAFVTAADLIKVASQSPLGIADLYRKTGLLERRTSSEQHQLLFAAHMELGSLYEGRGDHALAALRYQEVLKVEPRFAPAAHRLAWIRSEKDQDLDGALAYAQTALEEDPHNPHVADTLGWIYYRKNLRLRALTLLKEAAAKLPSEPAVQEHYRVANTAEPPALPSRAVSPVVPGTAPPRTDDLMSPFQTAP
jgi:tetratricopeptide (TPR) repeat protein